eukprot:Phypoly_transcript_07146.p1 GENE.Phypoly_transcript_07146~~Phypoly_transcript_07146.p1  ORF type:complete len:493 (+),score=37.02 Phypoly_transcript_07146:84-1562(+)
MNLDAFLTLVVIFVLSCVVRRCTQRTFQFPSPTAVPFLGNIFGINFYRFTDTFEKWHKQLGDTIECYFMHFKYIDSIDHKIVSQVLHSSDRDDLYRYTLWDIMGYNSVILLDGPVWKKQRRIISAGYTSQALTRMFQEKAKFIAAPAQHLVERLAEICDVGVPHTMDHEFSRVSLAVIGNVVFSYDFDYMNSHVGDPDAPFLKELWDGTDEYNKRLKNPLRKYLNPYSIWRFSRTMNTIRDLVYERLNARIASQNLNEQGEKYSDSLGVMLTETENMGDTHAAFSYPEVVDNVITLLLAGHETTGHAISFVLYEIARHPHVECKIATCVTALGSHAITDVDLAADGVLKYVGWVIMETLRLHPVAPAILRKWHTGQVLGDTVCNDEFNIGITLPMLHKDKRIWPDPEKFDPERFDENIEANKNRPVTSYLPFGGGPRTCIGKKLALMEMKYIITTLYRHYYFRLVPNFKYDVEITGTMHEIHGMPLLVQTRE